MQISNPIFNELKNFNLVSRKNIIKLSNNTRDKKNLKVLKDINSGVIFLEKYISDTKYYSEYKEIDRIDPLSKREVAYTITLDKGNIKNLTLQDDKRRNELFKHLIYKKNILDVGCGLGGFLYLAKKAKSLSGLEINKKRIDFIRRNYKNIIIYNNLDNLKRKFDLITMFHVLEHLPHQTKMLRKLRLQLKNNGKIIIEVPSAHNFLLSLDNLQEFKDFTFVSEHLILHTEISLRKFLHQSGFKKIKITHFQRYNLNNNLGWFIKRKPGGHEYFKEMSNKKNQKKYTDFLVSNKKTDTLIAVASKN